MAHAFFHSHDVLSLDRFLGSSAFRLLMLVCGVLTLALISGCGAGGAGVPVEGKVMLGDQPLTKGAVTFVPDSAKGNTFDQQPMGQIDESGQYSLSVREASGAPLGWYKVTVVATEPIDPKDEYSPTRSLVNERFADAASTPLSIEVVAEPATGAYDLKVTK